MRIHWHNVGIMLAILAGVTIYGFGTWSIAVPQGRGDAGAFWGIMTWVVGAAFVAAAFLSHRHTRLAKIILGVGSVFLIVNGLSGSQLRAAPGNGVPAPVFELLPAVLGLLAMVLIGPIQQSAAERRIQREGPELPEQPITLEEEERRRNQPAA
jgi:hypothetical protein